MARVPNAAAESSLLPMGTVARMIGMSDTMARRYFDRGELQGVRLANGERAAWRQSVEAFLQRRAVRP
ncbi:MAG: hypothetical protein IT523_08270 [Burkholderiales bacterium]|nr:hypothetical protein [Burkholderiales bacterium]